MTKSILSALILFILTSISFIPGSECVNGSTFTVGTVLFSSSDVQRQCWTQENVALLTTRMLMANLMPHTDKIKADDDSFISDIIEYFRLLLEVIRTNTNGKTKHIMLLAATDTMGGYMKHLIMPITKYSYYAGNIQYASIIRLYQLYDELKNFLRTNGEGWAKPWKNAGRHIQAKAISVQSPSPTSDPCKGIIYYKHSAAAPSPGRKQSAEQNQCGMEVPLPFFDSKTHPAAIAVPFRTFGLRNLESRVSAYILVKYFVAVSKCMAARNTNDEDVHKFNANIFSFIVSKVMPHLGDDKFYAAFGGVLRILQTVTETTKAKGHAIGNMHIMAETEDREPPDLQEDEEIAVRKSGKQGNSDRSRNNLILLAALATIIIWFCLGAAFVCCRIKAGKVRNEKAAIGDDVNVCRDETCPALYSSATTDNETPEAPHTKVLYSIKQSLIKDKRKDGKSLSSRNSKKSSKSTKSTKSTKSAKSHQTITSDLDSRSSNSPSSTGQEPVILRPRVPSVSSRERLEREREREMAYERELERERARIREHEEQREMERIRMMEQEQRETERELERAVEEAENFRLKQERARERERERIEKEQQKAREREEEQKREHRREAGNDGDSAQIEVHSVQYYPPTFACHTSMTGKVKLDSTSTEVTSREEIKRPYVFGYDFQTTSEESSPRDATSDGENEMAGNASK